MMILVFAGSVAPCCTVYIRSIKFGEKRNRKTFTYSRECMMTNFCQFLNICRTPSLKISCRFEYLKKKINNVITFMAIGRKTVIASLNTLIKTHGKEEKRSLFKPARFCLFFIVSILFTVYLIPRQLIHFIDGIR